MLKFKTADTGAVVYISPGHVAMVMGEDDAASVQILLSNGVGVQVENVGTFPVRRQIEEALK